MADKLQQVIVFQHDELAYHPEIYPEYMPEYYENIGICSIEYDLPQFKKNDISFYPPESKPTVGETFVRSPYEDNVYVNISHLKDYIIKQKHTCMCDIARSLGAKEIKGSFSVESVKKRVWNSEVRGGCKYINCESSIKNDEEQRLKNSIQLHSILTGNSVTLEDWKTAQAKANKYNLLGDPTIKNLLNARHPNANGGNRELSQHISFSISSETNQALDIAFNLNAGLGLFKLSADFHSSTEYRYETKINIDVYFPD